MTGPILTQPEIDKLLYGDAEMKFKAISLWQPWASLWACGRKHYETRHWDTKYRGLLLVHAAKRRIDDFNSDDPLREICEDQFGGHYPVDLPRGAIVGFVNLDFTISTDKAVLRDAEQKHMGDFSLGRFAWNAMTSKLFCEPIPYLGAQGFFNVPRDIVEKQMGLVP